MAKAPTAPLPIMVEKAGGVLGMVTYPLPDLEARLEALLAMATARGLDVDFHVDETGDPSVATLRQIAQVVLKTGYEGKVVCGHCCSLAVQDDSEADRTMDLVAEAGLTVVSLPLCNLYLQDRDPGRTPRWRGVTLVHEMKARGIPVAFASDNTRDPFYAYGDLDMVEVMRESTRIAHLDHTTEDWVNAFTTIPAAMCDFAYEPFAAGAPLISSCSGPAPGTNSWPARRRTVPLSAMARCWTLLRPTTRFSTR
jgi:cytosine deaminase